MASNLLMPILKSHSNTKGKWSSSGKGHSHSQKTWAKKIKLNSMRYLTRQRAVGSFFQIIKSLLSRRSKSTRHPSSRTLWSREKPRIVKACAEQVVKLISPTKVRCLRLLRLTMMTSHMGTWPVDELVVGMRRAYRKVRTMSAASWSFCIATIQMRRVGSCLGVAYLNKKAAVI